MDKLQSWVKSRRFWLMIAGVGFALAKEYGVDISREQIEAIALVVGAWIIGDSLRQTR